MVYHEKEFHSWDVHRVTVENSEYPHDISRGFSTNMYANPHYTHYMRENPMSALVPLLTDHDF